MWGERSKVAWVLLLQYQIRTVMAAQGLFLAASVHGHYGPNKDHRAHPHPKFGLSTIIWWRDMGVARVSAGGGWGMGVIYLFLYSCH